MHHILRAMDRLLSALARRGILPVPLFRLRHALLRYATARLHRQLRRILRRALGHPKP